MDCTNNDKLQGFNDITEYLVKLNGMYAFAAGWNVSANLQVQQGGDRRIVFDGPPSGYRSNRIGSRLGGASFWVYPVRTTLEPVQHLLDEQVSKSFVLGGGRNRPSLVVSVFNVLNANTVRAVNDHLNSTRFGQVIRILAPRTARVQVSVSF